MPLRFWYAAFAILVGAVGLGLDFYVIGGTMVVSPDNPVARSVPNFLIYYLTFLTNLSNLGLILTYLSDIPSWRWLGWFRHPVTRAGMAGIIALVMGFYHFMLAPTLTSLTGPIVYSNWLLHYVTPVLFIAWWLAFNGHGTLRYRDVPTMLVPGVSYAAYVLVRGRIAGEYPYTILDPTFALPGHPAQGYLTVVISVAVLVAMVAIFDLLLVLIDGLMARRRQPA
ncbi:MAG TPA: Pr6Pr family membrane protein [Devosia sp.]|nr:Pr6Pr family membrane protein [Devosia sp.]